MRAVDGQNVLECRQGRCSAAVESLALQGPGGQSIQRLSDFVILVIRSPPTVDADAPAGVETCIRLETSDAEADHALLRSHAVEVGEVLRWPGVPPMFMLRDPDGNRLEIIEAS